MIALVGVLAAVSAVANLLGTYMIKPIVNDFIGSGRSVRPGPRGGSDSSYLRRRCPVHPGLHADHGTGRPEGALRHPPGPVRAICRKLPLRFFDRQRKGDLMSLFTNDVDTVADALNNSFAMMIQSFIQVVGTLLLLFLLKLAAFPGGRGRLWSHVCSTSSTAAAAANLLSPPAGAAWARLDGYIEEMVAGQKVVKVFNHEAEPTCDGFVDAQRAGFVKAGTSAQGYAATMIPAQ